MSQEIFVRSHTTTPNKPTSSFPQDPKWPDKVFIFDTETTTNTEQNLTFGVYRLCQLVGKQYICSEEGILHEDELDEEQRKIIEVYVKNNIANVEFKSFPPKIDLKLYTHSQFVEKVFFKAIKNGRMIVGFNLPFDLSRIAVEWTKADKGGWSLILSKRCSSKTGRMEPNPYRPRIRVTSKDSQSAFIALARTQSPQEWPRNARFLDLHSLAFALFGESFGLDRLCEKLKITGKMDHKPSGKVSKSEIDYCRADVSATQNALNGLKAEFDNHPIELQPDRAYSPASIAKAYLNAMGVKPPKDKFNVSDQVMGIAMQSYYGGRSECRIRRVPVPVVHTDFTSQYPTVNTLLGNWKILTAESITFNDDTEAIRAFVSAVTLEDTFKPEFWKNLSFYALVLPNDDVLPVRAVYNGETQNIGVNKLTSNEPIWFAGPDVVASVLLSGKAPNIIRAIRMEPHGKQSGLKSTNLGGMIPIEPLKDDFFRFVVEQRQKHKSDKSLSLFLKVLANAGSYGSFVEITPEKLSKPSKISVFSGEKSFEQTSQIVERHGRWYFPPIAALITAGGRLLLAMLERSVCDAGGTYLFCDTDSLCIVSAKRGFLVACEGGTHKMLNSKDAIKALSWKEVRRIAEKFKSLNPYDPTIIPELLKVEGVNFASNGKQRQLYGFAISAKRYVLYQQDEENIIIVDPKAHGLGYLYPPADRNSTNYPDWTYEAWDWMLRGELELPRLDPPWVNLPAMMRIVLSTPLVLGRLDYRTRPYNFLLCPLIDQVAGYPVDVDPEYCSLITAFTRKRDQWLKADYINVFDGVRHKMALTQTAKLDKFIPQTYEYVLRLYFCHPESKSLAPDGILCKANTKGLLGRASIEAGQLNFVGKETDRRWSQGEDFSLLTFKSIEYISSCNVIADSTLQDEIKKIGIRETIRRTGLSQHTIEAIRNGKPIRRVTLQRSQHISSLI